MNLFLTSVSVGMLSQVSPVKLLDFSLNSHATTLTLFAFSILKFNLKTLISPFVVNKTYILFLGAYCSPLICMTSPAYWPQTQS